jgi:fucose 4-O-acetylase-like acetyltransferase
MALFFFISGLFVSKSLRRKGAKGFLLGRLQRLGLPFIVGAALLAPLAYYPTYLCTTAPAGVISFLGDWLSLDFWPTGPLWFLWFLMVFGAIAAGLHSWRPNWDVAVGSRFSTIIKSPGRAFVALVGLSAVTYVPLTFVVGPTHWTNVGPFGFQTSRLLHYAVYFFSGIVFGAAGFDRTFLLGDGPLARKWVAWLGLCIGAYALWIMLNVVSGESGAKNGMGLLSGLVFVISCAASSFAMLALFLKFARGGSAFWQNISDNTFGVYLLHYAPVSWLGFALLDVNIWPLAKIIIVTTGATILCWRVTAALRRVPAIRRVL